MTIPIFWTCFERHPALPAESEMEASLAPAEMQQYRGLKFPKRREEWLLGRWTAKSLLRRSEAAFSGFSMQSITIAREPEGAPYFLLAGIGRYTGSLSLSHALGRLFCALTPDPDVRLGVDVERIERRIPAFAGDYFTAAELARVNAVAIEDRDALVTMIWSAKEAVLKALGKGLRLDTRRVEIHPDDTSGGKTGVKWQSLCVTAQDFAGFWTARVRREEETILSAAVWSPHVPLPEISFQSTDLFG